MIQRTRGSRVKGQESKLVTAALGRKYGYSADILSIPALIDRYG
jgi:hypothetical protein